jgi:hypothetical protein
MWSHYMGSSAYQIREVAPKILEQLRHRVPDFPESCFVRGVSAYVNKRDNPIPAPASLRDELDMIAAKAIELAGMLQGRSASLADLLATREAVHGANGLVQRLTADLTNLMAVAEMARRDAESAATAGAPMAPRTHLIAVLAEALRQANLPVTTKAQDRLVLAFALALEAAGETGMKDPSRTVGKALETINAKQ